MRITFVSRKFGNVERNSHCDVLHITPFRVARLVLDFNGVFAIKAYGYENIDSNIFFFKINESKKTRGHNFTLLKKESRCMLDSFHFPRGPCLE